ncbi:o-succinylbenzoate--CoA ligase [Phocoenobacter skyensis]|uniref:O-succinylbenzoate--CoA ligase n=1 Tax=Phocoenobacter skyensis TaxID=97481 RepID=A0A1H7XP81_9PAST|nr:o-succinylbenzoate--CoA ligase [Pasteurella skyensis]MDP8080073.1 o-succinylbenzoate--CoA ligase [Pasteurella skyensis]MDP8086079.1 o-succinylbenzoate--CoA ligase [Pasteurella skyensis]MDP8185756.1 o-succinylbenzoate--CoA ligase [Pasteurella skyensis]QLB22643.1 o-succinylbenzoate--CoA ligase [Pasteurella skyensis]SEM35018.1 O-succinylbenzoic acid--CoA ligase [Pasteurella skyensis]
MAFSCFPTKTWSEQKTTQTAIVWNKTEGDLFSSSSIYATLPREISWQLLDNIIAKCVNNLTAWGIKPQQLVAYSGTHQLINLLCYCAVLKLGARVLMLNPQLSILQRQKIIAQNNCDIFITDHHFLTLAENERKNESSFSLKEPATFTLTSGSSGDPKAVVHSINNHLASAVGVCELMNFTQHHSWLLSLPLFHVSGQGIVWRWLLQGATLYIDENKQSIWNTLSKVTHASLVPTQLQRYLAWLGERKGDQTILLGGAHIPQELVATAMAKNITILTSYGLTEMASTVTAERNALDNVGKPLTNREIHICNNEIWVKGKSLALGYWLKGKIVPLTNPQGWFETKDLGYWNQKNQLVITGRKDNMFISGGENIQPEEIERVLFQSDLVQNIIVVPVKDDEFGERPVALVQFKQRFSIEAVRSLQEFAKIHLEKYKQPIHYFLLDTERWQVSGIKLSRTKLQQYIAEKMAQKQE